LALLAVGAAACAADDSGSNAGETAGTDPGIVERSSGDTTPGDGTAETSEQPRGPFEVVTLDGQVVDDSRDRSVPYRVYAPVGLSGPVPVVLVSHGGSGNSTGYARGGHLGSTFAAGGFLAVHVGHVESTTDHQVVDRPADVSHVLDRLADATLPLPADFVGTPDLEQVGHTGHSFGAYTSHAVGGATFDRTFTDDRVDAIAPISPQGADQFGAFDRGPTDNTWVTVTIPAYNLVGGDEADSNVRGTIEEEGWRLTPFRRYPAEGDKFLTVIDGQGHSDMWRTGSDEVRSFIAEQILAFFDVYVRGDTTVDACMIGEGELVGTSTRRLPDETDTRLGNCPPG
jgi:hypothetical protein